MANELNIEYLPVGSLKPYEKNAKKHPADQIEHIANSIREFGFRQPLVIDKDNVLVIGHGRLLAAKKLELDAVPCVRADDLTEEQIKALRLADNKTNESEWDFDLLGGELDDIFDIDMSEFGFELENEEEPAEVVEDEVPEDVETRCKLGDIWQLGNHRLVCGDSTDPAVIDRLMDGVKADMVFTDPPYGISVVGSSGNIGGDTKFAKAGGYKKVIGDDEDFEPSFILKTFEQSKIMLWGANYFSSKLPDSGKWLVWDKNRGEGTTFSDCELCWTNLDGIAVKKYKCTWDGMRREGESGKRFHPTQKPIKLCSDIIRDYSEEGDIIADLFGGSGSTLIACEQLNRKCYMCELDPHYCDVIIQRWENLTGETAVLLNG